MSDLAPTTQLLETLGLTAADQPLIEWQVPDPTAVTPIPPAVTYIGSTLSTSLPAGDIAAFPVPAGAAVGDVFVYVGAAGPSFGNHSAECLDPRAIDAVEVETMFGSAWGNLSAAAWGYLTDLSDVVVDLHASDTNRRGLLAVYRVTGTVLASVAFGDTSGLTTPPRAATAPSAGQLGILAMSGIGIPTTLTPSGVWTSDTSTGGAATFAEVWSAPSITPVGLDGGNSWITMMLGVDEVLPDIIIGPGDAWIADPDRSHGLVSYQVTYGRGDVRSRVQPAQITVRAALAVTDPPEIGDLFRIALNPDAATALDLLPGEDARFTGEVTDVQVEPEARTWQVIGVGTLSRQGRTSLTLPTAQTVTDRVTAILAGIGVGDHVGVIDVATVELAGVDAPSPGNALLDDVATSTLGQTVQQLDGRIDWHGPDHRRDRTPAIVLDSSEILSAITWAKHVGSILNRVTVNYLGGTLEVIDHASDGLRGPYAVTVSTTLTEEAAARSLGQLLVGRFASPAWDLPTLTVDVPRSVDPVHLTELFRLAHGDRVTITGLPADGPITGDHDFYLEGFTELASAKAWRVGYSVSDPALSGVSIRWIDVDPFLTWDAVDPAIRWIDVVRFEDSGDLGTPVIHLDGGDAGTSTFARTIDGGDATTVSFVSTIDGGTA